MSFFFFFLFFFPGVLSPHSPPLPHPSLSFISPDAGAHHKCIAGALPSLVIKPSLRTIFHPSRSTVAPVLWEGGIEREGKNGRRKKSFSEFLRREAKEMLSAS
ncbi:hypothetical protein HOY82DRAFT_241273 [Tuber indicum]|nr:hypothetical protein HOY82DRAFT_241273 [Tuber indicum]